MKVYVIEKGYYSDRHIVGVVETEDEAKRICDLLSIKCHDDNISYDVYDTKQFTDKVLRFIVTNDYDEWDAYYDDYDLYKYYTDNTEDYEDHFIIYANSPQQAIKIAQDMRAARIAKERMVSA